MKKKMLFIYKQYAQMRIQTLTIRPLKKENSNDYSLKKTKKRRKKKTLTIQNNYKN